MKSPIGYPGGKSNALDQILPIIPDHKEYREPFCGGASVFFAKGYKAKKSWINDKLTPLVELFQVIQDRTLLEKELWPLLKKVKIRNLEEHKYYRDKFKPENKVERALRYLVVLQTAFSREYGHGFSAGSNFSPLRQMKRLIQAHHALKNTRITNIDYTQVIEKPGQDVFLFLDPPYQQADQGIYKLPFVRKEHILLNELLKKTKHKFLLTYDNSAFIKALYHSFNIKETTWRYTLDHRQAKGVPSKKRTGRELLITNF